MVFSESDIDFGSITGTKFEEVCFDLLTRLGFQSLKWRQGGADKGRDIEGEYRVPNPLVEYLDKWFFECKNYSDGVPIGNMSTKFEWARAEQANHLVFFMVPYPTTATRDWLDKMVRKYGEFKVHIIEEKQLKTFLLRYSDIIEQHFIGKMGKLFKNAFNDWEVFDLYPDLDRFQAFCSSFNPKQLTLREKVLLVLAYIENLPEYRRHGHFRVDISPMLDEICLNAQVSQESIIGQLELISISGSLTTQMTFETSGFIDQPYLRMTVSVLDFEYRKNARVCQGKFAQVSLGQDRALQILTSRINDELEVETRICSSFFNIGQLDEKVGGPGRA